MKIVDLLFACVALFNFAKVGAMEHTHSTTRENPRRKQITITEVHNRRLMPQQRLIGDLFEDESIARCTSQYGQVSVKFHYTGEILQACLDPVRGYREERARGHEVFAAELRMDGKPTLEGDLTTAEARNQLLRGGHLFHGTKYEDYELNSLATVRFSRKDGFAVQGELYEFPAEGYGSDESGEFSEVE